MKFNFNFNFKRLGVFLFLSATIIGCSTNMNRPKTWHLCHFDELDKSFSSCNWTKLRHEQNAAYREYKKLSLNNVLANYIAPKSDGRKYSGEILFCVDRDGSIDDKVIKKPSGHLGLDKAFMAALQKTGKLTVPIDACLADAFYFTQKTLSYDETDMAN